MNTNQQNRFEIMKALEKDFPDRLLEDLIDVARYVEGEGMPVSTAAREFLEASTASARKWTNPHAIPSSVKAITDRDGDRAEPQTLQGKRKWFFTGLPFGGVEVTSNDGPFTEVPENE